VRDLFEQGKKNAPCIVFIDEIDAVGGTGARVSAAARRARADAEPVAGRDGRVRVERGGHPRAATNRPTCSTRPCSGPPLRPAHRGQPPGRTRPRGDPGGAHQEDPLSDDVDISVLARGTSGFCGADLANLVNEAALNAARYNLKSVRMLDFEFAKDKVLMGTERRSMIISDQEKRVTAIHEAGHALLTVLLPHADPIHKVTIIPRGMALGLTQQLPVDEKHNYSKEYLDDQIAILLAAASPKRSRSQRDDGAAATSSGRPSSRGAWCASGA